MTPEPDDMPGIVTFVLALILGLIWLKWGAI